MMDVKSFNEFFANVALDEFRRLGGEHVFIAPGSRSTPLVLAAEKNKKLRKHVHFDERGLGFYALGCARFTGKPTLVITTSGTAVANLYPAVIEAAYSHIPLIIFSADRPFELRESGANQAIDQNRIFGNYVNYFVDIPAPSLQTPIESILTTVDQGFYKATQLKPGPVQLNWMFQEPLAPPKVSQFNHKPGPNFRKWLESETPYTAMASEVISSPVPSDLFLNVQNGIVLLGSQISEKEFAPISKLIEKLKWPVLADIQSGFRFSDVISHADLILDAKNDFAPDLVLHIGGAPTSKNLMSFLKNSQNVVQVTQFPDRMDPFHLPKKVFHASVENLLRLEKPSEARDLFTWKTLENKADTFLNSFFESPETLTEPYVAFALSKFIGSSDCNLYLSSSRPIRDMDRFASKTENSIHVYSNRGTSGIDGNIATLAGTALTSERRTYALVGDLAALHDLNSFTLLEKTPSPITIILVNNNGGGIFSFLPISEHKESFEKYFGTPHGQDFEKLLSGFDINYFHAKDPKSFFDALEMAENSPLCSVIEVQTDRNENREFHRQLLEDFLKRET